MWPDLEDVMESEMSQLQEIKSCKFHSCEVLRGVEITETESPMGTPGDWGVGGECMFSGDGVSVL